MTVVTRFAKFLKGAVTKKGKLAYASDTRTTGKYQEWANAQSYGIIYKASMEVRDSVDLTAELVAKPEVTIKWAIEDKPQVADAPKEPTKPIEEPVDEPTDEPVDDAPKAKARIESQDADGVYTFAKINRKKRAKAEELFYDALDELGGQEWIAFIARHLITDGVCAFEVFRDENMLPVKAIKLRAEGLEPIIEEHVVVGLEYKALNQETITYTREDVIFIVKQPYEKMWKGLSALTCLGDTLDDLDELNEDITEVAKKMWKRSFVYEIDDSEMTEDETNTLMQNLTRMDPGKSIAVNSSVKPTEIKLAGDLTSLLEARSAKKSEISESFGLPRVLWSGAKSSDMHTLRPALALFYDIKIIPLQRSIARELTNSLWKPFAEKQGIKDRAKLIFPMMSLEEFATRVSAAVNLRDSDIIDKSEARGMLNVE